MKNLLSRYHSLRQRCAKTFKQKQTQTARYLNISLKKSLYTFAMLFAISLCLSLVVSACTPTDSPSLPSDRALNIASSNQSVENKTIRIGYQKYGTLNILKAQGSLEQRLKPQEISVQ